MPGIFDQILDRYEKSEDEWRIFLYNIIDKVTRKSTLKKSLPSYIKEEDFLSETFLVMDEIARSDAPRKDKITKLFACSRFTNVPQKSKLWWSTKTLYNLSTHDNDWAVLEKGLVQWPPEVDELFIALENTWMFSKEELKIIEMMSQWYSFRWISRNLWVSPSYWWTICNEIREKLQSFKDSWLLDDDYNCISDSEESKPIHRDVPDADWLWVGEDLSWGPIEIQ